MGKSHVIAKPFEDARKEYKIGRGLEKIGKTRFATIPWSSESVRRNLQPFRDLTQRLDMKIGVRYYNWDHHNEH